MSLVLKIWWNDLIPHDITNYILAYEERGGDGLTHYTPQTNKKC